MASILQLHCVLLGEPSDQQKRVPESALKAYFDISYTIQHSLRLNYLPKTAAKLQTSRGFEQQLSIQIRYRYW